MSNRYLQVTYFCNVTKIIYVFYEHNKKMLLIYIFGKVTKQWHWTLQQNVHCQNMLFGTWDTLYCMYDKELLSSHETISI